MTEKSPNAPQPKQASFARRTARLCLFRRFSYCNSRWWNLSSIRLILCQLRLYSRRSRVTRSSWLAIRSTWPAFPAFALNRLHPVNWPSLSPHPSNSVFLHESPSRSVTQNALRICARRTTRRGHPPLDHLCRWRPVLWRIVFR